MRYGRVFSKVIEMDDRVVERGCWYDGLDYFGANELDQANDPLRSGVWDGLYHDGVLEDVARKNPVYEHQCVSCPDGAGELPDLYHRISFWNCADHSSGDFVGVGHAVSRYSYDDVCFPSI